MRKLKIISFTVLMALLCNNLHSQINPLGSESFMQLDRMRGFIIMSGAALGSYLASEFLLEDEKLKFYQGHIGYYSGISGVHPGQEDTQETYSVFMQNFGIESEFSRWFSMRVEANIQEFTTTDYATMGTGLKFYSKWTALRKKKIHPFFEYGYGVFYAFDKFPQGSSNFTFNLSYAIGAEYILNNQNKIRLDFNFLHHSNNNLFTPNLGFDGNGVSISYSWFR